MKKIRTVLFAAACVLAAAACEKTPVETETEQDKALKAAVEQYVPNVIYKIYGNLADASEQLYNQLSAMKSAAIAVLAIWLCDKVDKKSNQLLK